MASRAHDVARDSANRPARSAAEALVLNGFFVHIMQPATASSRALLGALHEEATAAGVDAIRACIAHGSMSLAARSAQSPAGTSARVSDGRQRDDSQTTRFA
jgi:hypothetical protein